VLGSPKQPLSAKAARAKFDTCWHSVPELPASEGTKLWDALTALEGLDDVSVLAALLAPYRAG